MRALAAALLVAILTGAGCGGDDSGKSLELPVAGRWFGFSSNAFEHTGRERGALDQGLTAHRTVADARAAGANAARVQVAWWDLERRRGSVDRSYVADVRRFVDEFGRAGGRVVIVLGVPPPWASAKPGDARAAPAETAVHDYAAYAGRVARLFPEALAIETWNEPNTTFFWAPGRPDPGLYARMHRAAAQAIRRESPRITVLLGGILAVPNNNSPDIAAPSSYLKRMYAAGLTPADYDGVAVHVYPGERDGRTQPLDGPFDASMADLRSGLSGQPPLWVTETGVTSSGPDGVAPDEQARGLVAVLAKLFGMDDVKGVWVHTQYDVAAFPQADPQRGYGVLRARRSRPGDPKPAFCALREHLRQPPHDRRCAQG